MLRVSLGKINIIETLTRNSTTVRPTHLYPTFLALHAAGPRLSVRDHLQSSELCSLVVASVTAHCPGFGALPSAVSLMVSKGRERGGWLEVKGYGRCEAVRTAVAWRHVDLDSGQGDSPSSELNTKDRVVPGAMILTTFPSCFQHHGTTLVLYILVELSSSPKMLQVMYV